MKFQSRSRSGVGEIVNIKGSTRGKFYEVKPEGEGKNITLRAAQLTAG